MVTFACVLFEGVAGRVPGYSRGYYSPVWVDRLFYGLQQNVPVSLGPHGVGWRLICLTDTFYRFESPVERIPLSRPAGWFSLLEPMAHVTAGEQLITLGLDSVVAGDLADLVEYRGEFGWLRDPYNPALCCNGLSSCSGAKAAEIWATYLSDPEAHEQASGLGAAGGKPSEMVFLRNLLTTTTDLLDDFHPGRYLSYKCHLARSDCAAELLAGASLIYFHGRPRQSDLDPGDPVRQLWQRYDHLIHPPERAG